MPAVLFRKRGTTLTPAEQRAAERLAKVKDGVYLMVDWRRVKSPRQMRLYFSVLRKVYDALPERFDAAYPSFDTFRESIQIECGFGTPLHSIEGELIGYAPKSISRAGQDEFNEICHRVFNRIYERWLDEIGSPELRAELDDILG